MDPVRAVSAVFGPKPAQSGRHTISSRPSSPSQCHFLSSPILASLSCSRVGNDQRRIDQPSLTIGFLHPKAAHISLAFE
jgi:hypothetical protein